MNTTHFHDKRPNVFLQLSIDDFGDEVMAVVANCTEIPIKQIIISEDTWWTLFDFRGKLLDWQDGHDEE
jgi:hypothetical protein